MARGSRQLFISYARNDAERVNALVEGLRQLRYDAWLDQELTGGQAWWDTVLSQIRASSALLVAVSPTALESVAVRREYEYGHAVRRPLLPVLVDRVRLEMLPSRLAELHVVDYCQPGEKSAFALVTALAALPSPQALPRPLPDSPPIPISYLSGLKERSQAATLSRDEQLLLVAELKGPLGRPSDREAAEEMLRSLQSRNDLYEATAREIESLLASRDRQVPAPRPHETPSARPRASAISHTGLDSRVDMIKSQFYEFLIYAGVLDTSIEEFIGALEREDVSAAGVYACDYSGERVIEVELRVDWELSAKLALTVPNIGSGLSGWDDKQAPEIKLAGRRFAQAVEQLQLHAGFWSYPGGSAPEWKMPPQERVERLLDFPELSIKIRRAEQ